MNSLGHQEFYCDGNEVGVISPLLLKDTKFNLPGFIPGSHDASRKTFGAERL